MVSGNPQFPPPKSAVNTIGMPNRNDKGRSVFDLFAIKLFLKMHSSRNCELQFFKTITDRGKNIFCRL